MIARWRQHFTALFRARNVRDIALIARPPSDAERVPNLGSSSDPIWARVPSSFRPSQKDVWLAIRKLADAGLGEDAISASQLKAGGWPLAIEIHAIIEDIVRLSYIPLVWRGGKLVVLYKGKGPASSTDSNRGILVGDHLSKIITSLLSAHLNDVYHRVIGPCQFGAAEKRGTSMASLMLRSFMDACIVKGLPFFVLFLDLIKAFDFALRELVMGWMGSSTFESTSDKHLHLASLGIPQDLVGDVCEWIDKHGGLLREAGVDENVVRLVNCLHDGAWFRIPGDSELIVTSAGGRQGCKLGALVFNLAYSIALKRARVELAALGLLLSIKVCHDRPFWASHGADFEWSEASQPESVHFEIAFVDDIAAYLSAPSVKSLLIAVPILVRQLSSVLHGLGFKINWDKNKTECFINLRGAGAATAAREIHKQGSFLFIDGLIGASGVRVVKNYRHLGNILESTGSPAADVPARVSSAMSAYCPISSKIFGANKISQNVRLRLFSSLVVSRLLYNVHVWSSLPRAAYLTLNSVYMRGLRRIANCCRYSKESASLPDVEVRKILGVCSFQCLLSQRRLLLLSSVVRFGSDHLKALLSVSGRGHRRLPWVQLVVDDMLSLQRFHKPKLDSLGAPDDQFAAWHDLIKHYPAEWAALVRTMSFASMPLDVASARKSDSSTCSRAGRYKCTHCSASFGTSKALGSHCRAKHKSRTGLSCYVGLSKRCPVCMVSFSSRTRLLAHVSDSRNRGMRALTCHDVLRAGLCAPVPEAEHSEACQADRALRRTARRSGHTQPLSEAPAKRRKVTSGLVSIEVPDREDDVPSNQFQWRSLPPAKRLRSKTPVDAVVSQHIPARSAV